MTREVLSTFVAAVIAAGVSLGHDVARAQSLVDYTAEPPFVSETVTPNILIIFDNSGSMQTLAHADSASFSNSKSYTGIFDPLDCYDYDATSQAFEANPKPNGSSPPTNCADGTYPWSGNLLNFVTMRRIDVAKQVMIGGNCDGARDAEDKCPSVIKGQDANLDKGDKQTSISSVNFNQLLPNSISTNVGETAYFHHPGNSSPALAGYFCVDDDVTYPPANSSDCQNLDTGWSEPTPVRIAVKVTTPSGGVLQEVGDKARFAMMKYAVGQDGGPLIADMGTSSTNLVSTLDATKPPGGTGTPLAEMLYEAARYYAQIEPPYLSTDYSYTDINKDPYYFTAPQWASTSTYVRCCESSVILFTDGEPNGDDAIPPVLQDYFAADGSYVDDVAYWFHTTDLRQPTIPQIEESGKDLPGFQKLTLYTFLAFGSGSTLLQNAAKAGGFQDRNGNNQPDLTEEWDRVNNSTGADGPDGIPDNYFESDNASFLKDRLLAAITTILQRSGAGSAASVLASSSTGEGAVYQSFFFPNTLKGLKEIKWTGYTQGLFLDSFGNLREDTNGDARMVYEDDRIIRSRFDMSTNEVMLDRFDDADGNGVADTATPVGSVGLRDAQSIWEAGTRLAQTAPSARNLLTWVDRDNNGLVDSGEQITFHTDNTSTLAPYLRPRVAPFTTDNIINFIRGDQIAGLRDRQLTVEGTLEVWKLGDSIHAQPLIVGAPTQRYDLIYGDASYMAFFQQYKDRRQVAYVGANDGMLHAFNAGYYHRGDDPSTTTKTEHGWFTETPDGTGSGKPLGKELFGFIPQELLPHLTWLTQPDYTHVYYVDLTPKVTDVRIFTPDAAHPNGWGTILMGGFRMGGSCGACVAGTGAPPMTVTADFDNDVATADTTRTFYSAYFVLDITNPEVDPRLLWSFSSADLGLTTTVPSMLRVSPASDGRTDDTNAKWYMVAGSGPTGYDAGAAQKGNLYAIDLKLGPGAGNSKVTTLPAEQGADAFMGDTLTIDRDFDYRVDVTYMGSVIDDGTAPWRGKLYRLTMNDCIATPCSTLTWGVQDGNDRISTEVLDTFLDGDGNPLKLGPIAAAPAVAIDDANKVWVFAGTGRYYNAIDKTNTDQQYFLGVKDSVLNGACMESSRTSCLDNDLVDVSTAEVCLIGVDDCGSGTDQVTGVTGATDFPSLITLVASKDGWYTTLPASGERALVRPLVFGGLVLFPTFTPTNDICAATGSSALYALYYRSGTAYSTAVIGTTNKSGKDYVNRSKNLGEGMASAVVVHMGQGSGEGKVTAYVQTSTGELTGVEIDTDAPITSRFLSWFDQRD